MDSGDASTLTKIAIFCISFSMIATILCGIYDTGTSDYDYETIKYYQGQLYEYTGGQLVNDNPWMLTHVYTPFDPDRDGSDMDNHVDPDGWVYGSEITTYPYLQNDVNVKLDPNQKSNQKLTYGEYSWSYQTGETTWHTVGRDIWHNVFRADFNSFLKGLNKIDGIDVPDGYIYNSGLANNWNYTGYRYVFDPVLPFNAGSSARDGSLSIVWYNTADDTGISGGLQVYKNGRSASHNDRVILAEYSASEIIANYQSSGGYATVFNFDFDGIIIHMAIQFGPMAVTDYASLKNAWDTGNWDMAISTPSAGNFFDVDNSTAFVDSAGSMLDTFIQIYTFEYPKFQGEAMWANLVLWLIVGLPMTMGLLLITMRMVGGVFRIFG